VARAPVKGALVIPLCGEFKLEWGTPAPAGETLFTNILHFTWSTKPTFDAALAESIFSAAKNAMSTSNWTAFVHPTIFLKRVQVKDITAANLPWFLSTGPEIAGTGLLSALPEQVAVVVTSKTAKSGREWHGRSYLGGLDAGAQLDGRHHGPATGTAGVAFMETMRTTLAPLNVRLALGQRALQPGTSTSGAALPARVALAVEITGFAIQSNRFDTQRRRLGR
jgi:hypothetical protein